jgi:hypothetical protein
VASSRFRSSLWWRYWFVCSHYRWIWLPFYAVNVLL